jgi:hypothetical protein
VSSCLFWTAVDEDGTNPVGNAGAFEFRIWYEVDFGDEDFMTEPSIEITNVDCVVVQFDGEDSRTPTVDEDIELSEWLESELNSNVSDMKGVEHLAFEYSYIEHDQVDWVD